MAVEVAATRRRFTRAEYYRMAEVGILGRRDRVELISGEIIEMSPIGRRHQAFVDNLGALLVLRLADRAIVRVQGPVALADDTEPEPDLTCSGAVRSPTRSARRGPRMRCSSSRSPTPHSPTIDRPS